MSYEFTLGTLYVKEDGQLKDINVLVGDTEKNIKLIKDTADKAILDTQQKGAQTLASIPEDYTELSKKVSQQFESMNEISDKLGVQFVVLTDDNYVPFILPKNKEFTIKTSDGSTFKNATVKLYDESKTALDYWEVRPSYGNKRTITNTYDGIVYVAKVLYTELQDLIVEYIEDDSILEEIKRIDDLENGIEELNDKIFCSEIISKNESYFDCAIPNGAIVTVKTHGGEPFESADFKVYNSAHVALDYWHLSSNYGNKRTITNTFDGVMYVAIANRNGNTQPIVISVGEDTSFEKRIIKLEEKVFTVVDKSGNGDFTRISDAVANAKDNESIYVKAGVYDDEIVEAWGKTVHLIGESRNQVIVSNNTGAYATPPIEIGSGTVKNMTVIAYGNATVTGDTDYAIHVEDNNLYNKSLLIENCTLIGYKNSGLGMGMRGGCNVELRNCDFIGKTSSGLFMHDAANSAYKGVQNCIVDECNIITEGTAQIMRIDRQNVPESEVYYTFRKCFLRKTTDISSLSIALINTADSSWKNTIDDLPNCHLTALSFGNNKDSLNYGN